ncbi:MAG: hypothetical protein OEY06_06905 [Gammaproteobacteria bacterium]|nr:hypothetical protein [Gammaproteobacteria bacterium]
MNKLKLLIPLLIVLLNSGCASFGPTVRIETPEPAEDFLLLCDWAHSPWYKIHGGRSIYNRVPIVAKSGEDTPCGMSPFGGHPSVSVMHPIYLNPTITEEEDVTIYRYTETILDYLDKQKEKFEAGFWDKFKWPSSLYVESIKPVCGFGHQYFDYYREVKKIDYDYFKETYYDHVLNCYKKLLPELKKHDKSYLNAPSAEKYIEKSWQREYWEKYNDN